MTYISPYQKKVAYLRYMQKISGKLSNVLRYSYFMSPAIVKIMGCRKLDPKNHCSTYKQKQALNLKACIHVVKLANMHIKAGNIENNKIVSVGKSSNTRKSEV